MISLQKALASWEQKIRTTSYPLILPHSGCANMGLAVVPVLSLLFSAAMAGNPFPDCVNGPLASNLVCNTSANFLDRAQALVNEMTLEEMVNNTVNASPGVPRLGLPPYEWWSEALVSLSR